MPGCMKNRRRIKGLHMRKWAGNKVGRWVSHYQPPVNTSDSQHKQGTFLTNTSSSSILFSFNPNQSAIFWRSKPHLPSSHVEIKRHRNLPILYLKEILFEVQMTSFSAHWCGFVRLRLFIYTSAHVSCLSSMSD